LENTLGLPVVITLPVPVASPTPATFLVPLLNRMIPLIFTWLAFMFRLPEDCRFRFAVELNEPVLKENERESPSDKIK
jgi:hypothetical protein